MPNHESQEEKRGNFKSGSEGVFPVGKQRLIVEATTKPGREKHGLI